MFHVKQKCVEYAYLNVSEIINMLIKCFDILMKVG